MTYNEIIQKVGKRILKKVYYLDGETIINVDKEDIIKVKPSFSCPLIGTVMLGIELELKTPLPDKKIYVEIVASYNGNTAAKKYGPYYLKEKPKYNADDKTYTIKIYDEMLKLMVNYTPLDNISFPCTIYSYFLKFVSSIGLKNSITDLPNGNLLMYSDVYKDIDNFTKRDVLHDIGQANGVLFYIDDDTIKIAELGKESSIINDDILKNSNIEFGEHFGPINSIVLSRSADSDSVFLPDEESIAQNGLTEFKISDNQLMNDNNRSQFLPGLLNHLKGIEYDIFDTELVGYGGFVPLQKVEFQTGGNKYYSYVFNNEIEIEKGYSEAIYTDMPEETETDYKVSSNTDKLESMVYRIADKQNKKIEDVIQEVGEASQKVSQSIQTIDEMSNQISNITMYKKSAKGTYEINTAEDTAPASVLSFKMSLNTESQSIDAITISWRDKDNNEKYIVLIIEGTLRKINGISDSIEIAGGAINLIRKISKDGEVLSEPIVEILEPLKNSVNASEDDMILFEGANSISYVVFDGFPTSLKCFDMEIEYLLKNDFTDRYAQKIEIGSYIEQHATEISNTVIENLDDETFGTKIVQNKDYVKYAWNQIGQNIKIEVDENNNASFNIYDEKDNLLMALNKDGMIFYDDSLIGKMGVITQDKQKYIAFNVPIDFESKIENGFAWGVTNNKNGIFYPILYIKDFYMGPEQSDVVGGQLVLANCGLTIEGQNMITLGNVIMMAQDPLTGDMTFLDRNNFSTMMKITPQNDELGIYKSLSILDHIGMYVNQEGAELFHVGETSNTKSFWTTSNGYVHCDELSVGGENSGRIYCHGDISSYGDIDAAGYVSGHIIDMSWHESKKDIAKYTKSAIKEIKSTDIYSFLYKDGKSFKKTIGAVIGDEYNCSDEIVSEDGKHISIYSMISLAYKAIQEQQEKIEELERKIEIMKGGVNKNEN